MFNAMRVKAVLHRIALGGVQSAVSMFMPPGVMLPITAGGTKTGRLVVMDVVFPVMPVKAADIPAGMATPISLQGEKGTIVPYSNWLKPRLLAHARDLAVNYPNEPVRDLASRLLVPALEAPAWRASNSPVVDYRTAADGRRVQITWWPYVPPWTGGNENVADLEVVGGWVPLTVSAQTTGVSENKATGEFRLYKTLFLDDKTTVKPDGNGLPRRVSSSLQLVVHSELEYELKVRQEAGRSAPACEAATDNGDAIEIAAGVGGMALGN